MRDLKIFGTVFVVCALVLGALASLCHATGPDASLVLESVTMDTTTADVEIPVHILVDGPLINSAIDFFQVTVNYDTMALQFKNFTLNANYLSSGVEYNTNPPFVPQCAGGFTTRQTQKFVKGLIVQVACLRSEGFGCDGVAFPHEGNPSPQIILGSLQFHHKRALTAEPDGGYTTAVVVACQRDYNSQLITELHFIKSDNSTASYGGYGTGLTALVQASCVHIPDSFGFIGAPCPSIPSVYFADCIRCPPEVAPPKPAADKTWSGVKGLYR
jgi:hypothetical protein